MRVSIEALNEEERVSARELLVGLGAEVDEVLTRHSQVHIERSVTSPRYRLAILFEKCVVGVEWINVCARAKALIDPKLHEFGAFGDTRIHFHGFDLSSETRFRSAAIEQSATIADANEAQIVVCADPTAAALQSLRGKAHLLPLQWFLKCLERCRFVPPEHFARGELPRARLVFRLGREQIARAMAESEPAPLFARALFCFGDCGEEERQISAALVNLFGGLTLPRLLNCTTHFVAERIARAEIASLPSHVALVTPRFLVEAFLCRRMPDTREFYPTLIDESSPSPTAATPSALPPPPAVTSFLFERVTFHIPERALLPQVVGRLTQHCGRVVEDVAQLRGRDVVVVLSDGFAPGLLPPLRARLRCALFVSPRWIDFCIARRRVVRGLAQHLHLLPLSYSPPRADFAALRVAFKGLDDADREQLQQLLALVGATVVKFDLADATQTRIVGAEAAKKYEKGSVRDRQWLLDLVFTPPTERAKKAIA